MRELTREQKEKIRSYYKIISKLPEFQDEEKLRHERTSLVDFLRSPAEIDRMNDLDLRKMVSNLWAYSSWTNIDYVVEGIIKENPDLRKHFKELLYGDGSFEDRFTRFLKSVKHFGPAAITEILCLYDPQNYGIWNDRSRKALKILGFDNLPLNKYYITGAEYSRINGTLKLIAKELQNLGHKNADLITVDLFLWLVWKYESRKQKETGEKEVSAVEDFDHNEIKDFIQQIGIWLGFEANTEEHIAKGAQVDVAWRVKIANLGVITYVFEVHRKGSIDSLILNLQKAISNPTVQKVIAVSTEEQIERIKKEVEPLPENFRKMLAYWNVADVINTHEKLKEVIESLSKLELVKSQF
ncbi:MAG: Uncharacterized protein XD58_1444 [Thermotoga sp. 50_1627]|nr:MAG: Uncharacterized protein XD58_1444 [Thermotoga sp. 50_1627]